MSETSYSSLFKNITAENAFFLETPKAHVAQTTAPMFRIGKENEKYTFELKDYNSLVAATIDDMESAANKELEHYKLFELGWDGYRGIPFHTYTINTAKKITKFFASFFNQEKILPKEITPGPISDGRIDIELGYKDRALVFTIDPDSTNIEVVKEDSHGVIKNLVSSSHYEPMDLEEELNWLVG